MTEQLTAKIRITKSDVGFLSCIQKTLVLKWGLPLFFFFLLSDKQWIFYATRATFTLQWMMITLNPRTQSNELWELASQRACHHLSVLPSSAGFGQKFPVEGLS